MKLTKIQGLERVKLLRILALKHGLICWYCGLALSNKSIHIDHIIPKSKGGANDLDNYALACSFCNWAKHDKDLDMFLGWLQWVKSSISPHQFENNIEKSYTQELIKPKRLRYVRRCLAKISNA